MQSTVAEAYGSPSYLRDFAEIVAVRRMAAGFGPPMLRNSASLSPSDAATRTNACITSGAVRKPRHERMSAGSWITIRRPP